MKMLCYKIQAIGLVDKIKKDAIFKKMFTNLMTEILKQEDSFVFKLVLQDWQTRGV